MQLNPCKSCVLIQLIDFAVISLSLSLYPAVSLPLQPLCGLLMAARTVIVRPGRYLGFQRLRIMRI